MSSLNHIFKFGTTALAALVLSACSSSGGGSDDQDVSAPSNQTEQSQPSTAANNTQQPTTSSSQPTSPTTTPNQVLTAKNIGFVIPKVKGAEVEIAYPKAEAVDLDVLNVEGKSFNIVPTGWAASEVLEITSNNVTRLVSGTKYKNVRWGLISQEGLNNHYLLAYGINPTTNMPATGQATYVGNGVHSYASNGEGIDTYHLSNAKFNVNLQINHLKVPLLQPITNHLAALMKLNFLQKLMVTNLAVKLLKARKQAVVSTVSVQVNYQVVI